MIWGSIVRWLTGGGLAGLAEQVRLAHEAKLNAENNDAERRAEHDLERLNNALEMARAANEDRWSATSIGRFLIVVPFGIWWSATFLDSTFDFAWATLEPPRYFIDMAAWLVPAIVVGDVGKSMVRRVRR